MRIGLSVITQANQNIWSNGLTQNLIFFAQTLRQIPFVTDLVFLNCGDQDCLPPGVNMEALGARLIPTEQATDLVDVVFEFAGALDVQWLDRIRQQGKVVIAYLGGQPYVNWVESALFEMPVYSARADRMNEVWLLPKDYPSFSPMMRTLCRCPVQQAPYIWSPEFLEQRIAQVTAMGWQFGYRERPIQQDGSRPGLSVAMFEPNISVVKTSLVPLLICDQASRMQPTSVEHVSALNTLHLLNRPAFDHFAQRLNLQHHKKIEFLGRHDFVGHMVQKSNAVVSHQWQNDQNYSYLDALYGAYPLVHNSPWIKDYGYYFEGSDVLAGAQQLLRAHQEHEHNLVPYRQAANHLMQSLHPLADSNVQLYADLLSRYQPQFAA